MPWIDAFGPAVEHNRQVVMRDTWGHLAPVKNRSYRGFIVFAVGCFGSDPLNPIALQCEFVGLDSSPWLFDHMSEFLSEQETEVGKVYRFDGTFKNYKFAGTVRELELS